MLKITKLVLVHELLQFPVNNWQTTTNTIPSCSSPVAQIYPKYFPDHHLQNVIELLLHALNNKFATNGKHFVDKRISGIIY